MVLVSLASGCATHTGVVENHRDHRPDILRAAIAGLVACRGELPGEQPVIDPQRSVSPFSPKVE